MSVKLIVTRLVTPTECKWLDRNYHIGEVVYTCTRPDYGCVNNANGFAATEDPEGGYPFFEMPWDSVRPA